MAWALTQSGFSGAATMTSVPGGVPTSCYHRCFVILGSVLEGIPAIVLFGPLLFPIAQQVGIHEVHYAMVVILAMGSACSRRPSASAITSPAPSAGFIPTKASSRCWAAIPGSADRNHRDRGRAVVLDRTSVKSN